MCGPIRSRFSTRLVTSNFECNSEAFPRHFMSSSAAVATKILVDKELPLTTSNDARKIITKSIHDRNNTDLFLTQCDKQKAAGRIFLTARGRNARRQCAYFYAHPGCVKV